MKQLSFILLFSFQICWGQKTGTFRFDSLSVVERFKQDVSVLAYDSMGGREPGTVFETKAGNYILKRFQEAGINAFAVPFELKSDSGRRIQCSNIVAFINNHADSTVVIGAHYDHLGVGGDKSREILKKGIHPGADDNASGVALMLEWARMSALQGDRKYNYVFLAFSAHEMGLFGSKNIVQNPIFKSLKIKLFINFDMVGRLDPNSRTIRMSCCSKFPELKRLAENGKQWNLNVMLDDETTTTNDFSVFCAQNIPSISITTGVHDDYHRMGDMADKINFGGMLSVFSFLLH